MSVGVVILCRYSSRRLPGKILMPIANEPILSHIVARVRQSGLPFLVATSDHSDDDAIAMHCQALAVDCFRGSLDDVAARFLAAARSRGWRYAARINGDNLFVHYELLAEMAAIVRSGEHDLVTNVPGRTWPPGASVEIVDVDVYAGCYARFSEPGHHEHVTSWLYEHADEIRSHVCRNPEPETQPGLHLAIDTPLDYERADRLAAMLGQPLATCPMSDILRTSQQL